MALLTIDVDVAVERHAARSYGIKRGGRRRNVHWPCEQWSVVKFEGIGHQVGSKHDDWCGTDQSSHSAAPSMTCEGPTNKALISTRVSLLHMTTPTKFEFK